MGFEWPPGWPRVPDEAWTDAPVETLAAKYDEVQRHTWYRNLDPTVEELAALVREGDVVVDYSGGTGILPDRLLARVGARPFGLVDVDSSPKFLALALHKFRDEPRIAFRLVRWLKQERRLQTLDEALGAPMVERGVDVVVSTNAIHLYYDLVETLRSWHRSLRPGGRVLVQSGNIRADGFIIDDTVEAVHEAARRRVRADARLARHRAVLDDADRMRAHDELRRKYFLPPRPLEHYVGALKEAGFEVERVETRPIRALAREWLDFLMVYHDGVLGWVGGTAKVEGHEPDAQAVEDRRELMRDALSEVLGGREAFDATWTYITCRRP